MCMEPWLTIARFETLKKDHLERKIESLKFHLFEGTTFKKPWKTWSSSSWLMSFDDDDDDDDDDDED